jgi:two-component system, NarL family, nitrate/nitrite response regulator NarL
LEQQMQLSGDLDLVIVVDSNPLVAAGLDSVLSQRRGLMGVAGTLERTGRMIPGPTAPGGVLPSIGIIDPTENGFSASAIVAANPELALVAYMPTDKSIEAGHCLGAGFRGILAKTSPSSTILAALQLVAQGGLYIDAPFAVMQTRPGGGGAQLALSEREVSVLRYLAKGMSAKEIGQTMQLSGKTIETYKARAATKLNLRGRRAMVDFALRSGLIGADA